MGQLGLSEEESLDGLGEAPSDFLSDRLGWILAGVWRGEGLVILRRPTGPIWPLKLGGKVGMSQTEQIKAALHGKKKTSMKQNLLGTGSTLLNLACSGSIEGGFLAGHYYFFVGDTTSGKTWLSLTCFAEATLKPEVWGDYRFIYDGAEFGALMDIGKYFGKEVAKRMEPPEGSRMTPIYSQTVEEMYYHIDDALEKGRPFVYVQDSQDALSSSAEQRKFAELKKAHRRGKDSTGSWGDNKAKVHSANIRKLMGPLKDSGSILIILNQTRDSFDIFSPSSYSGGRALKFYATLQLWSSVRRRLKKTVRGKERQVGIVAKVAVKKNRLTGKERMVEIPIYNSHGMDDVGSCIDYLVDEKFWVKSGSNSVCVKGLGPEQVMKRDAIIRMTEEDGAEDDLRELVGKVWEEIESASAVKRKRRYE